MIEPSTTPLPARIETVLVAAIRVGKGAVFLLRQPTFAGHLLALFLAERRC